MLQSSIWSPIPGGITAPLGFQASAIHAGLKPSGKFDLSLILAPENAICAGTFTQSVVRAECVNLCVERLCRNDGKARAILVNSGQANACTGSRGLEDSLLASKSLAKKLDISEEDILICSTGVIGQPIPMQNLLQGLGPLVEGLSYQGSGNVAKAILTTDLREKEIAIEAHLGGRLIRIGGIAKGSGMIHPNMATMLGFLTCDAGLPKDVWLEMIKRIANSSFNSISVDGDTSTNDTFLAFCAGEILDSGYYKEIEIGLQLVSTFLAKAIARDGEGSNCLIEVKVEGANTKENARLIARTISSSSLVKTAVHGCDPNWGRIIAAAGRSGVIFRPEDVSLWIGSFQLMKNGLPMDFDRCSVANHMKEKMLNKGINLEDETLIIKLQIGKGNQEATAWGCDLSDQYVHINADYTT